MEILYPIYGALKLGAYIFSAAKMVKREMYGKPRNAYNVNVSVGYEEEHNDDCDTDDVMVTVGAKIFSAVKSLFRSRRPSNQAVPGLSAAFAAHRNELRRDLAETTASVQSIGRIVAEGLMGIQGNRVSGNSQMMNHLADIEIGDVRFAAMEGLEGIRYAVPEGSMVAYKSLEEIQQMRGGIERLEQVIFDARMDCEQYFNEFSSMLDDVQMRVEKLQGAPLKHAQAELREFTSGEGGLKCLDKAYGYARDALYKASSLEAQFNASIILVTTGYARIAKHKSPQKAKTLVAKDTFITVAGELAPSLCNTSATCSPDVASVMKTTDGNRAVAFLLDIAYFIFLLPPANVLLPQLPLPLVEAFGILCASNPQRWMKRYPEVGLTALRFFLERKSFQELRRIAHDLEIDVSMCVTKSDVIQALVDAEKPLTDRPRARTRGAPPRPTSDEEQHDSTATGGLGYDVSDLIERALVLPLERGPRGTTPSAPMPTFDEKNHATTGGHLYGVDDLMERANAIQTCYSSRSRARSAPSTPTLNGESHESTG